MYSNHELTNVIPALLRAIQYYTTAHVKTTGSATPTQPSIYSRLNPLKKRGKEEGGGGHYQHLDHEKGKREDKVNDHKNPLPSPEEYGTLETVRSSVMWSTRNMYVS